MPEMHLRQLVALGKPWFTYSACGPCTKNKERMQKFKETICLSKQNSFL